jgi:general secretion pathway protein D
MSGGTPPGSMQPTARPGPSIQHERMPNLIPVRRLLMSCGVAMAVSGCTTAPPAAVPRLDLPSRATTADAALPTTAAETVAERMPAPPGYLPPVRRQAPMPAAPPAPDTGSFHLNFEQVPLSTLLQVVYADILGKTVQIDPNVRERRDLVTLRTPAGQTAAQVQSTMDLLVKSYGLAALDFGAMVRIVPDGPQSGVSPEIRRGAALPETPERLRPVFQLVDLEAVRNTDVAGWLKTVMGNRVTIAEDATRNALMLSGTTENVAAAIGVVKVLDQPVMRDRASLRVTPVYWSVQELATTLGQVLAAEGYSMPPPGQAVQSGGIRYPIILLPVPASNALLVFSVSDAVLRHVQSWIDRLDQPNKQSAGKNLFTYTARNVSAESLARTLGELMQGGSGSAATAAAAPAAAATGAAAPAARATASANVPGVGRVVVDGNSNTLIFNTSAENYSQLISLLNTLDQPSKSALIEVTVAEVTLGDDFKLGIEWLINESGANSTTTIGTLGGLALGTSGLTIRRLNSAGDARLVLNALANTNRATILSSPRVMARNGETALIQVGQEVPVITSQQTGVVGGAGTSGVLQTVQYRSTGVILEVKPSIFSGNRIDLDVAQEVSSAQSTVTGVNISPTISTRKVQTKLTLEHGSTVMLGGLISDNRSSGDSGVPGLKDVPLLGAFFRTDDRKTTRTELVVLITPYIISNGVEAAEVTEAFKRLLPMLGDKLPPSGAGRSVPTLPTEPPAVAPPTPGPTPPVAGATD